MRRKLVVGLAVAAGAAFFMGGLTLAWSQTGEPTVGTETFVVTYTIPTVTETTVSTETVTTTVTETVTVPNTTTEPPPTTTEPDPPDPPTGTRIVIGPNQPAGLRSEFVCDQPVVNYATAGLPLIIETHTDPGLPGLNGDVRFQNGCVGDPDAHPDVILKIGWGQDEGSPEDMVNFGGPSPGPRNLQITGSGGCAPVGGAAHQDGFQIQFARDVLVYDFELGDWETQTPGCHGAGGLWYASGNQSADRLFNVVCTRCRMVGSSPSGGAVGTGFYLGLSTASGAFESCFSANRPFFADGQAVNGIDIDNLYIDRNSGGPQPSPADCQA